MRLQLAAKPAPTSVTGIKTAATAAPTATQPLTAEQLAKNKQQQDAKIKALVQDQASRLKQLEHANLEALAQNQELQLKMIISLFRFKSYKVNEVRKCFYMVLLP